jgi:hypothetical protein
VGNFDERKWGISVSAVKGMDAAQTLTELSLNRCPISHLTAPPLAGFYAIYSRGPGILPGIRKAAGGLLYVGSSSD